MNRPLDLGDVFLILAFGVVCLFELWQWWRSLKRWRAQQKRMDEIFGKSKKGDDK